MSTSTAQYLDSELGTGTHVYWISNTGLIDHSAKGSVVKFEGSCIPVDPEGQPHFDLRWVIFPGEDADLISIDNLIPASMA
jgi:hypothetical protein